TVVCHLTWNAGVRKVIYTLHGSRGALTIDDDTLELARVGEPIERKQVASDWVDASHAAWFADLQIEFASAIRDHRYASWQAIDAWRCLGWIEAAYRSARDGSRLTPIHATYLPRYECGRSVSVTGEIIR